MILLRDVILHSFVVDKKSSALVCNMLSHVRRLEDGITAVPFLQVLLSLVSQPEHVEALVETAIDMGANITVRFRCQFDFSTFFADRNPSL